MGDTSGAVEGAEIVIDKALAVIEAGGWLRGLEMLLLVIEEMIELLQSADDSNGDIGWVIKGSLGSIADLVRLRHQIPSEERMNIFRRLLEETRKSCYEGWEEWQLDLLEAASELIESDEMQREWDRTADSLMSRSSGSDWERSYTEQRLVVLRHRQIAERSGEERAHEYAYEHLRFPEMRELALRAALDRGDAAEAIRLAEEGEARDQGWRGLVDRWRKHRYEAYVRSGQVEAQRKLGMELIISGEYSYYRSVKETFSDEGEWAGYLQELLDQLEQRSGNAQTYEQILVDEGMHERLLRHVRKAPYRIESYYRALLPHYPEEVKALFAVYIENLAQQSTNRREYANVCKVIRLLKKVGGREEAFAVTRKLMAQYSRKPAFPDELGKILR